MVRYERCKRGAFYRWPFTGYAHKHDIELKTFLIAFENSYLLPILAGKFATEDTA